jgi:S1-C subfamily serine protease
MQQLDSPLRGAGAEALTPKRLEQTTGREDVAPPVEPEQVHSSPLRAHWREFALSLFAALVAFGFLFAALGLENNDSAARQQEINAAIANALASATPRPPAAVTAYQAIRPSLVQVMAQVVDEQGQPALSYGTGFVIDDTGTILTSLHVVKGAGEIQVAFADGSQSKALIAKQLLDHDLAFLHPTAPPAQIVPATLGDPNLLQIGDQAIVVGNPMRLVGSLSTGSISGLNRVFQPPDGSPPMKDMIQIDAAVNPGNSGGPLLNGKGEVVGVITGRASPSGQEAFIGIGFAVPIDVALSAGGPPPW